MPRRWSRLSTLVFLVLLYTAPLSSGDKGLWLSLTAMPVQLFGVISGGTPPEHEIVLPDQERLVLAMVVLGDGAGDGEPTLDALLAEAAPPALLALWSPVSSRSTGGGSGEPGRMLAVPRGPPA